MKLHDLRPATGSRTERIRVGRGIAAGKGKTAGRGTKGQKSRTGGSIPPGFEGGQTPLHRRIPKLRGFKVRGRVEYEVVNVGAIARLAEQGAFETGAGAKGRGAKAAPTTINQDILRGVGLVRTLARPLKILGQGDLSTPLFVVADAFSRSAVSKIESAGGTVSVLERSVRPTPALGTDREAAAERPTGEAEPAEAEPAEAEPSETVADTTAEAPKRARRGRSRAAAAESAGETASEPPIAEADGETEPAPESATPVDEA
jgi:large subunit ribosomal protein L15